MADLERNSGSCRYTVVDFFRNNLYQYLLTQRDVEKTTLNLINYRNLHKTKYFLRQGAEVDRFFNMSTDETLRLHKTLQKHAFLKSAQNYFFSL